MRVKTFRGQNMQAVFAKVKAVLGDDAVILSNKTVTEDGKKVCEVMAAVDQGAPNGSKPKTSAAGRAYGSAGGSAAVSRTGSPSSEDFLAQFSAAAPAGAAGEWAQIKDQIMALLKPHMDMNRLSPRQRLALEYLEREGVSMQVVAGLYNTLRRNGKKPLLTTLEKLVPVKEMTRECWSQKFQVFAGPSGVGKTSTLIRLALAEKKANPKARICLASADNGQGKGRIVLRHYAELSGLAFREIACREDFAALKGEKSEFDVIYIDLPGLARSDTLEARMGVLGMSPDRDMAVHLVLSPFFAPAQIENFLERYNSPGLKSVVWTKLDEACTFGAIVNTAAGSKLPVSALSFGTGLKGSLAPADKESLWRLIFKHKLPVHECGTRRSTNNERM